MYIFYLHIHVRFSVDFLWISMSEGTVSSVCAQKRNAYRPHFPLGAAQHFGLHEMT